MTDHPKLQCINPNDGRDTVSDAFERAGCRITVRPCNKANVGEVFPFHQIGDVRYVRIEIDILAQEMRAVSQPVSESE
jgi:hypothetical protein